MAGLGAFVQEYIDRVVNRRDLTAVDDLVSADYRGSGHGWPGDVDALKGFYARQAAERPDWRIDVRETVEAGEWVAVRALAGGTVDGRRRDVEWLATYRVRDGRISEIHILALDDVERSAPR